MLIAECKKLEVEPTTAEADGMLQKLEDEFKDKSGIWNLVFWFLRLCQGLLDGLWWEMMMMMMMIFFFFLFLFFIEKLQQLKSGQKVVSAAQLAKVKDKFLKGYVRSPVWCVMWCVESHSLS